MSGSQLSFANSLVVIVRASGRSSNHGGMYGARGRATSSRAYWMPAFAGMTVYVYG
jgi:hypothetical protein